MMHWKLGKPAAFDAAVKSPLTLAILVKASVGTGAAASVAEVRKQTSSNLSDLSWAGCDCLWKWRARVICLITLVILMRSTIQKGFGRIKGSTMPWNCLQILTKIAKHTKCAGLMYCAMTNKCMPQ